MGTTYEIEVVVLQKLPKNIRSKEIADATLTVFLPTTHIRRISPEQITEHAFRRDIGWTIDIHNIGQISELRRNASMHAKDLILNDCSNRHSVEGISKGLPYSEGKFAFTCIEIYLH